MPKYSKTIKQPVEIVEDRPNHFGVKPIPQLEFKGNTQDLFNGGSYFILFEIKNLKTTQYYFESPAAAFTVGLEGTVIPAGQQFPYCRATSIGSNTKKSPATSDMNLLLVRNDNPSRENLKYTLNLVSAVGQNPIPVDPIMNNQNTGCPVDGSSLISPWAGVALGLGLVGIGTAAIGLLRSATDD